MKFQQENDMTGGMIRSDVEGAEALQVEVKKLVIFPKEHPMFATLNLSASYTFEQENLTEKISYRGCKGHIDPDGNIAFDLSKAGSVVYYPVAAADRKSARGK